MASTKNYLNFILDELSYLGNITYKPMMGEYLLYYNNQLFGGIYDDRLLVKIVDSTKKYHLEETIPYEKGKPMYFIEDIDNKEILKDIVINTYNDLIKKN